MLKRKITDAIDDWFKNSKSALLIDGARQIGKTTVIEEYLKRSKTNYVELNLLENKLALEAFNTSTDAQQLQLRISSLSNKPMVENETIVFIDEIQEAKDAITPIKFLVQDGRYKYIFSGSLLGIKMQEILSIPAGFLTVLPMYPMDFEEFAKGIGVSENTFAYLRSCFEKTERVDEVIHKQMMALFNTYLVVGGMPKAVQTFVEYKDIYKVNRVLSDIDYAYREGIAKYQKTDKLLIQGIYDLIPSEINAQNKRFILKKLNEKARFYQYEESFAWIKNSGVGLFVHNVDNPIYPLLASKERTLFKLFPNDVGLLTFKLFNGNQAEILNGGTTLNYGAVYESVVAQELKAHGFELYYNSDKKRGEIDFLIEVANSVTPIEVKSGKDYKRHSALRQLMSNEQFKFGKAYVFCNENVESNGKVVYLPIYMVSFINKGEMKRAQIIDLDISKLV